MPAERLLSHARQLFGLANPRAILAHSCRVALEVTGARMSFASFVPRGQPWDRGLRVAVDPDSRSVAGPELSALFAIHRRVVGAREPSIIEPSEETAAIFAALGPDATSLVALPILQNRSGSLGELVLRADRPLPRSDVEVVMEIAHTTAVALENAQKLAAAKRDQDRMLLLAEATDEALWDWNLDGGELWWGGSIHKMIGGGPERFSDTARWRFAHMHPDDVDRVRASLEAALGSTASSWRDEYRFRRADGSWLAVEDRGYFLRETDGRAYRAIGALRDVSPLKDLLERERRARAQAETANRAKDEFLAMLGHELRNPLAPIVTAVQLMEERGAGVFDKELKIVERQTQHMIRLVDDLLDVSRITRGKIDLARAPIEVAGVVARALEMASPLVEKRAHEVVVDVAPRGLVVDGDAARLAQVISNLLTNAAKYTKPGGRIEVCAAKIGDAIEIRVKDSGIGIAPEMLGNVFDLFVQERQGIERSQGGLGIGLSIVRSLTELHGGTVHVKSEGQRRGSEFMIRLPAVHGAHAPEQEPESRVIQKEADRRVMIVDDNEDAAELLAELLARMGVTTCVAHDGPTALRMAERFAPQLALLDIGLPVMDGYELARRLRDVLDNPELRLVAVTGYGQDSDKQRAESASFDAHLVKPVTLGRLQGILRELG